jgi:hypothetical protein
VENVWPIIYTKNQVQVRKSTQEIIDQAFCNVVILTDELFTVPSQPYFSGSQCHSMLGYKLLGHFKDRKWPVIHYLGACLRVLHFDANGHMQC